MKDALLVREKKMDIANLRRYYTMRNFLEPDIFTFNTQHRIYEIILTVPVNPFVNQPRMFNDVIARVKAENNIRPND